MSRIVLQPLNPLAIPPEDLQDLAEEISRVDSAVHVEYGHTRSVGYAVTPVEGVLIWISLGVSQYALEKILDYTLTWIRRRYRRQEQELREREPERKDPLPSQQKYVEILGPDGRVIRQVFLRDANAQPEDTTALTVLPSRQPPVRTEPFPRLKQAERLEE